MTESGNSGRAGTIAAAAATLTAIVAVVIALWDNVQTRRHNRLSVLPYVVIERFQQDSSGVIRGEITMSNEGVGPAILRSLEIRMQLGNGRDTTLAAWGQAAPLIRDRGIQIRGWTDVHSRSALGVQRNGRLLRIQAEGNDGNAQMQAFLDALYLRLRYESVYGDTASATLGTAPVDGAE